MGVEVDRIERGRKAAVLLERGGHAEICCIIIIILLVKGVKGSVGLGKG